MTLLGIVRNPQSRRNRGRPTIDSARLPGGALLREPASHAELDAVCREFAARGVTLLAIDGGDGTIRDVLTSAVAVFDELPPVALLASGKTNILAANVGSWGAGPKALARLALTAARGEVENRRRHRHQALSVGFANRHVLGFVFGTGAFRRAVALSDRGANDRLRQGPRVAMAIGRSVLSVARKGERRHWLAGMPMSVAFDHEGADPSVGARFLFMATTLKRFTLGVWPFWNHDGRPLRYLDVEAMPPRFASALLPALRGRPRPWMAQAGYRSGSATRIRLQIDEPFVLDGESYAPGPDGRVVIEAGPVVEFVAR